MDEQPKDAEGMPGELVARVVHELSALLRNDLELAVARQSRQVRRLLVQATLAVIAAGALLLAGAAFSSAGAQALGGTLPTWEASAIVGVVWLAAAVIITGLVGPRRLLYRFESETGADSVARIERERIEIEQAISIDAERFARIAARAAAESAVGESVSEVKKLAGAVHSRSDGIVNGLAATLPAPRSLGRGLLDALEHRS
jgi:hypothetical protein